MKKDTIKAKGEVIETLPNAMFKVQLETKQTILAHLAGKLRIHYIKIVEGDMVIVELSPYDLSKGRIIKRL